MNLTVRPVTRLADLLPGRDPHGRAQGAHVAVNLTRSEQWH
jgi:hypothetical protein